MEGPRRIPTQSEAPVFSLFPKEEDFFGLFRKQVAIVRQGCDQLHEMVKAFKQHNVEVITLTPAEYDAWLKVARESSYAEFAKEVPDGKQLIDDALGVK